MILVIDNFDSFTYNIVHYLFELGEEVCVYRNNAITLDEIRRIAPDAIIISPGPKEPKDAGISKDVVATFAGTIPILGICLGHQVIGEVFGGKIVRAHELVHGKVRNIFHDGKTIFSSIDTPTQATRYHSLVIDRETCPTCLEVSAVADDGEIMAVRHKQFRVEGIQFHPESILTEHGKTMLSNFVKGTTRGIAIKSVLTSVAAKNNLTEAEARTVMELIMSGRLTPSQTGSLLTALRMKGETVDEITGFAQVMRSKAAGITLSDENVVDTCGTGGDAKHTFNISTAAAFVVAGSGVRVAKHGNRALSSSSGSADVLESLGVNIALPLPTVAACIHDVGIGFLFAPACHKAMKYVMTTRREIGIRTVFNVLGPLSNPAGVKYQVMGVYDPALTETLALVLGRLGARHVFVVSSYDGLDEITLTCKSKISEFSDGELRTFDFDPQEYGMSYCTLDALQVANVHESKEIILRVLKGEQGPQRDIVVLNAMLALVAVGAATTFEDGIAQAVQSIDSGAAYKMLQRLVEYTHKK